LPARGSAFPRRSRDLGESRNLGGGRRGADDFRLRRGPATRHLEAGCRRGAPGIRPLGGRGSHVSPPPRLFRRCAGASQCFSRRPLSRRLSGSRVSRPAFPRRRLLRAMRRARPDLARDDSRRGRDEGSLDLFRVRAASPGNDRRALARARPTDKPDSALALAWDGIPAVRDEGDGAFLAWDSAGLMRGGRFQRRLAGAGLSIPALDHS